MKNKKAASAVGIIAILAIFLIAVGGIVYWAVQEMKVAPTPEENVITLDNGCKVPVSLQGKKTTFEAQVYDASAANTRTLEASTAIYLIDVDDQSYVMDAKSASATQRVTESGLIGHWYKAIAFNSSREGVWAIPKTSSVGTAPQTKVVGDEVWFCADSESTLLDLNVYKIAAHSAKLIFKNNESTSDTITVVDVDANGRKGAEITRIDGNNTYFVEPLGGIYVDVHNTDTNVTNIDLATSVIPDWASGLERGTLPKPSSVNIVEGGFSLASTQTDDYTFKLDPVVWLLSGDYLEIGGLYLTADGDGCLEVGGETVTFYLTDWAHTKSQKPEAAIIFGPETNAASPADAGISNPSFTLTCN